MQRDLGDKKRAAAEGNTALAAYRSMVVWVAPAGKHRTPAVAAILAGRTLRSLAMAVVGDSAACQKGHGAGRS